MTRRPEFDDGVAIIVMPRVTADGVTVVYCPESEPCVICLQPCYLRVDGLRLHTDRCLDRYRKAPPSDATHRTD